MKQECQQCGKIFSAPPTAKFCSRSCLAKSRIDNLNPNWRGGKALRHCETCGKEFYAKQKDVRAGFARFCSRKCWGISRSKEFRGEKGCNWQGGLIKAICEQCGQAYQVNKFRLRATKFCSRKCMYQWKRGENHCWWRGGPRPYPKEWNEAFRQAIRERDNHICVVCRMTGDNVHHINYTKDDTTPENCITLCRKCHSATNIYNRHYWQEQFTKIMEARQCILTP